MLPTWLLTFIDRLEAFLDDYNVQEVNGDRKEDMQDAGQGASIH